MTTPGEAHSISQLSELLYPWLPGSNPPYSRAYTFAQAASEIGLPRGWIGGSKRPAIENLVEAALRSARLGHLVQVVLREGVKYRGRRGPEITRDELHRMNDCLKALGLRMPELSDETFLNRFPQNRGPLTGEKSSLVSHARLLEIREAYRRIETNPDPQSRGYEFQGFLQDLFDAFGLEPRKPFRVSSEEIDGSFVLDSETYLLEARWRSKPTGKADLVGFQSKVESKSVLSRGLFVSIGRIAPEALSDMRIGKAPRIVVASKKEMEDVLDGIRPLDGLLRAKVRRLMEEGCLDIDQ